MKRSYILTLLLGTLLAATIALTGCFAPSSQTSTDEHAAEHRAYMAQLGQKADELDTILADFQAAVGTEDVVAMKAASNRAMAIVEEVKNGEAPEKLAEVKESYALGLDQLQQALSSYTQLYADVASGAVPASDFQLRLGEVQKAYDAGVEAVKAADEKAVELSKE